MGHVAEFWSMDYGLKWHIPLLGLPTKPLVQSSTLFPHPLAEWRGFQKARGRQNHKMEGAWVPKSLLGGKLPYRDTHVGHSRSTEYICIVQANKSLEVLITATGVSWLMGTQGHVSLTTLVPQHKWGAKMISSLKTLLCHANKVLSKFSRSI